MAIIIDRISASIADKVLSISNEQCARTITIGSTWNRIRIGVRFKISSSFANITSANFAWGLISGTSSLYADASTNHFLGVDMPPSTTLTYTSATINLYRNTAASASRFITKVGLTTTEYYHTVANFAFGLIENLADEYRMAAYMDIMKSNTDPGLWTIMYTYNRTVSFSTQDISATQFYNNITNDSASLLTSNVASASFQIPISQSANGNLDTINIYWNKTTPPMEISDVAVYRFA